MLKDMGIRVWMPASDPAPTGAALPQTQPDAEAVRPADRIAGKALSIDGADHASQSHQPVAATAATQRPNAVASPWQTAGAHALYGDLAPSETGPRWLVLAETAFTDTLAEAFHPFNADAGRLLDNMLRACGLRAGGRVILVPLVRLHADQTPRAVSGPAALPLEQQLADVLASHRPHVVLVMGRLAAQELLQSTEPLGKLRGRVHRWQGYNTVVTYDAQPLLRTPADKAKAWDDLCLAMAAARDSADL